MSELLRERYELFETLGVGGEGRVVRALDHQHKRTVGLKIRPVVSNQRRSDLLAEARILLSLPPHPNLPLVRDDFFDGDRYVIVMDWVDGTDLDAVLRESSPTGLPVAGVLRWLADAAAALTHLHTQDPPVIHGDVKPANLILTEGGRVVLVDFGLSSLPGAPPRGGTVGFAAPELAAGHQPSRASDVYSLAATAWALLTGSAPAGILHEFGGLEPEDAVRVATAIRVGLATDAGRRPATAGELVELIRAGWASAWPTGVVTFCLTDIEDSTAHWDAHPAAMARALVQYEYLVATAAEAHRGHVVRSAGEGDPTVSVFTSAKDAVAAAAEVQRRVGEASWPDVGTMRIRSALHTGEAERRGDDYHGATLNVAAQLRGLAAGGEVYLTGATASLVGPALPPGWSLVELGPHRLAGAGRPVAVFALAAPGVAAPPAVTECPYPGLLAFDAEARDRFFGREGVVDELARRIRRESFTALVGSSGSGKSSVLRAGVVPTFPQSRLVTPGNALPPDFDGDGLLIVDQFEELFTTVDVSRRGTFIETLLARSGPVLIGLRADFYGRCSEHAALAAAVASNQVLLGPLHDEDLRRAIVGPAESAGLRVEPGLVDLLIHEVRGEPGALPLLSHALRATWKRRDGRTLTLGGYHEIGGVRAAIANTADQVLGSFEANDRRLLRSIFLRLVEPGEGTEDTARRAHLDELRASAGGDARIDEILRGLADARLVSIGEQTMEVAHEALIREWPQLRAWLDEDREGIRIHRHLTRAARTWKDLGRDQSELYRGNRLAVCLEWSQSPGSSLSALEREFLEASRGDAERARRAELVANRRLRVALVTVASLLVLAMVAGSVAVVQARQAGDQRRRATDERDRAEAARVGTLALATVDKRADLGLLLAASAYRLRATDETAGALLGTVAAHPQLVGLLPGLRDGVLSLAFTPDGRRLITPASSEGAVVWSADTRRPIASLREEGFVAVAVAVTPDSRRAVIGASRQQPDGRIEGRLQVWNLDSYTLERAVRSPAGDLTTAAFVDNGRLLLTQTRIEGATSPPAVAVVVWDTATWQPLETWSLADEYPEYDAVTVSADGRLLAVPVGDGRIQVYGTGDHRALGPPIEIDAVVGHPAGRVLVLAFSPDASVLAATTEGGSVVLIDPMSGKPVRTALSLGNDAGTAIGFRPDGTVLAVSRGSGSTQLFDVATGQPIGLPFGVGANHIRDLAWSADGSRLATFHSDFLGALWSFDGSRAIGTPLRGQRAATTDVAFARDGTMYTGSRDGTVAARANTTGESRALARTAGPVRSLAIDTAGRRMAAGDDSGTVSLWSLPRPDTPDAAPTFGDVQIPDVEFRPGKNELAVAVDPTKGQMETAAEGTGRVAFVDAARGVAQGAPIELPNAVPVDIAYSPDGRTLAVAAAGFQFALHLFDAETHKPRRDAVLVEATSVTFSPDGEHLFVGTARGIVERYDARNGKRLEPSLEGDLGGIQAMDVSVDGRWLATTTALDRVRLWDLERAEPVGRDLVGGSVPRAFGEAFSETDHFSRRSAFSPDGTRLVAGGLDGAVLWDLRPRSWLAAACSLAGRNLTDGERARFVRRSVDPCPSAVRTRPTR